MHVVNVSPIGHACSTCMTTRLIILKIVFFYFFSSPFTSFYPASPSSIWHSQLMSIDLSLHHKRLYFSLPHEKPHLSLSLSTVCSFSSHPPEQPQISLHYRCHHHPQAPNLTNLRYIHLPLYYLVILLTWLICKFLG